MNSKKRRREVDHVDESEIVPNRHYFVSIVGREIEGKVPLKPPSISPLTIVSRAQSAKDLFLRRCIQSYSN